MFGLPNASYKNGLQGMDPFVAPDIGMPDMGVGMGTSFPSHLAHLGGVGMVEDSGQEPRNMGYMHPPDASPKPKTKLPHSKDTGGSGEKEKGKGGGSSLRLILTRQRTPRARTNETKRFPGWGGPGSPLSPNLR